MPETDLPSPLGPNGGNRVANEPGRVDHANGPATPSASPAGQPHTDGANKPALPIALALQGGSAWGAYTWGAIDALLGREDLSVDAISGTSAVLLD